MLRICLCPPTTTGVQGGRRLHAGNMRSLHNLCRRKVQGCRGNSCLSIMSIEYLQSRHQLKVRGEYKTPWHRYSFTLKCTMKCTFLMRYSLFVFMLTCPIQVFTLLIKKGCVHWCWSAFMIQVNCRMCPVGATTNGLTGQIQLNDCNCAPQVHETCRSDLPNQKGS